MIEAMGRWLAGRMGAPDVQDHEIANRVDAIELQIQVLDARNESLHKRMTDLEQREGQRSNEKRP